MSKNPCKGFGNINLRAHSKLRKKKLLLPAYVASRRCCNSNFLRYCFTRKQIEQEREMATAYKHQNLGSGKQVASFARQRIYEIEKLQEKLEDEKEMWKQIILQTKTCPQCGGDGKVRVLIDQDESELRICPACDGSGKDMCHEERPKYPWQ
jgi:hypothetical protein